MNAISFIERDSVCTQAFLDSLGVEGYDWNASKNGSFDTPSNYQQSFKSRVASLNDDEAQVLDEVVQVPEHSHDEEPETGLLVVTILIWVAIAIIIMVAVFMYLRIKMKKD